MASTHVFADDRRGPRLQKVMAEAGVGSRRACEELITEGAVTVNGHLVCTLPAWVHPVTDRIAVHGRMIRRGGAAEYIMLFKPRGVVCTSSGAEGRPRAIDLVDLKGKARLFPVGRLDMDSSGLLLLTNDGELANRLTHPRYGIHKTYEVTVDGAIDDDAVRRLESGLFLTGRRARGAVAPGAKATSSRVSIIKRDRDRTRLRMELREGRNRQVRRMMARLGFNVKKLRRIQLGPLKLRGLKPGQWRRLLPQELERLQKAAYRSETSKRRKVEKSKRERAR